MTQSAENDAHHLACALTHGYDACTCATFAENDVARCEGCGYTKYGHAVAMERMIARRHDWQPRVIPPASTDARCFACGLDTARAEALGIDTCPMCPIPPASTDQPH